MAILLIFFCAFLITALILYYTIHEQKVNYDERQAAVRGRGFMYAFLISLTFSTAFLFLDEFHLLKTITLGAGITVTLYLSGTVCTAYCILNDAFYNLKQPQDYWMYSLILAGCSLVKTVLSDYGTPVSAAEVISPLNMIFFGIVTILLLWKKRQEDHEESQA